MCPEPPQQDPSHFRDDEGTSNRPPLRGWYADLNRRLIEGGIDIDDLTPDQMACMKRPINISRVEFDNALLFVYLRYKLLENQIDTLNMDEVLSVCFVPLDIPIGSPEVQELLRTTTQQAWRVLAEINPDLAPEIRNLRQRLLGR